MKDTLAHCPVQVAAGNDNCFPGGFKLSGIDKASCIDHTTAALGTDGFITLAPLFTHTDVLLG